MLRTPSLFLNDVVRHAAGQIDVDLIIIDRISGPSAQVFASASDEVRCSNPAFLPTSRTRFESSRP